MSSQWMVMLSVAAGGLLLGAWGDHDLYELPPVPDPGPCTPPTNSSSPVGLRGYRRYFANDSLIGRPVPCTRDEKICFQHNLVFDPSQDRCEAIGWGGDEYCDLRPNRTEFEQGGRIIGVCKTYEDPCPGYRMAYDSRCYRKEVVRDVICGCGAKPTRHLLEGVECRSSPATPITIQQPKDEGRCPIPDLRFPNVERPNIRKNTHLYELNRNDLLPDRFKCNSTQAECFAQGKVWVQVYKCCYELLGQGPSPEEHMVVLDFDSATKDKAEGTCVHVRGGCPKGYKRMPFDGQCHEDREIAIEAPGRVVTNYFGQNMLIDHLEEYTFSVRVQNDLCHVVKEHSIFDVGGSFPDPPCEANSQSLCDLYEIEENPPKPEL